MNLIAQTQWVLVIRRCSHVLRKILIRQTKSDAKKQFNRNVISKIYLNKEVKLAVINMARDTVLLS